MADKPNENKQQLAKESSALYQMMADHASNYSTDDRLNATMLYVTEGNMKKTRFRRVSTSRIWHSPDIRDTAMPPVDIKQPPHTLRTISIFQEPDCR